MPNKYKQLPKKPCGSESTRKAFHKKYLFISQQEEILLSFPSAAPFP